MGHAVLHVEDVEPLLPFYRDLLGFRVSDYGLTPYKLYFFHLNGRHHSFAMVGSRQEGAAPLHGGAAAASTTSARATTWPSSRTGAWPTRSGGTPTTG